MKRWLKRLGFRISPTVTELEIGRLSVESGVLLLADPMMIESPVRVEAVPPGRHPVHAQIIRYPEGGQRVAGIAIRWSDAEVESRVQIGAVGVDSASVVAVDEGACKSHWKRVGPDRIGLTSTPNHNLRVARLISEKFGLKFREVNGLRCEFLEPVSVQLEQLITRYLQTFPEYARNSLLYFGVYTRNTFEQTLEALDGTNWGTVVLDKESGASLLAVSSGFGDGEYPVELLHGTAGTVGIAITFIGPAQDDLLESFPFLRG